MNNFIFSGCDTVELAKKYGTPLYVMSEDLILERIGELKKNFDNKYERAHTHYASKAFLTKDMIRILKREGLGMDVVSGGELYAAMELDFPAEHIMFHGNSKPPAEIETALDYGVGRFVCDSIGEILTINEIAARKGVTANILIRVTPGVDAHTHRFISTAMADSKFGVPLVNVPEAVKICMDLKNLTLQGFHFHVGSQLLENTAHLLAIDIILQLIKNVKDTLGFVTNEFDLGGGFGVAYNDGDQPQPLEEFLSPMVDKIETFCKANDIVRPFLMIEPGRYLVGNSGITLYTVNSVKDIPDIRTYIGVDGGMTDNPRTALYDAKYTAVVANKYDAEPVDNVRIAGRCCESTDILIYDIKLPKIEVGDIIAFKTTGAYNYSMSSNFNRVPIPELIMIKDSVPRVSVRRQTYADLYAREV